MDYEITRSDEPGRHLAVTRFTAEAAEIGTSMAAAFGTVFGYLGRHGIEPLGPPMAYYVMGDGTFEVRVGCAVGGPITDAGTLEPFDVPAATTLSTVHVGTYDELPQAYDALRVRASELGLRLDPVHMWEEYLTGPEVPPEEQRTVIHWPVDPEV
ncbi:GyrI-like domain-containing protein [Nocardioides sp. NPDC057767]|uniref:GyrI-like domain-containing protein n=1 Tax=unclassified Nocardioides TaxID=2615069 RepID=UPI0036735DA0